MTKKFQLARVHRGIRTTDVSFTFRAPVGIPGHLNRGMPFRLEPTLIDPAAPPLTYGQGVVLGANNGVRQPAPGDTTLTRLFGVTIRPNPSQQATATANFAAADFGPGAPPLSGVIDILRAGYFLTRVYNGTPVKEGPAFMRITATAGGAIQGYFRTTSDANTVSLTNVFFTGPADAQGLVECYITN